MCESEGHVQERLAECPFCMTHHEPHCPPAAATSLTVAASLELNGCYATDSRGNTGVRAGQGTRMLLLDDDLIPPWARAAGEGAWRITVEFITSPPKR
jgi:hypothetical protein